MSFEEFKKEVLKYLDGDMSKAEERRCEMRFMEGYKPEDAADDIKYGDWLEEFFEDMYRS